MAETNSVETLSAENEQFEEEELSVVEPVEDNSSYVASVENALKACATREPSLESYRELAITVSTDERTLGAVKTVLSDWGRVAKDLGAKADATVLQGYCYRLTAQPQEALEAFKSQKRHEWGGYYYSRLLSDLGRKNEALAAAKDVVAKFPECRAASFLVIELECRLKNLEEARGLLDKCKEGAGADSAEVHYYEGLYQEAAGEYADAIAAYRSSIERSPEYQEALFRLAYLVELHGTEADEANDVAVELYERCVKLQPVHTNAVVNLGLLYEDRERYHDAIKCYETVLRLYPNHARAKLYLRDAQASTSMFYDKDQEKKADRQSQVLKIPVTDFELSVRSRNCLQKMNIRTLGDLIMKSEQELLSYKNFGETSLDEIKVMLNQKGLRLGQGLEDKGSDSLSSRNPLEATAAPEVLDKSIEELELSVRSRRCMERLGVADVRDLINKTEVELMAAKNFGMTSLNEIKRKLQELGLGLRG